LWKANETRNLHKYKKKSKSKGKVKAAAKECQDSGEMAGVGRKIV